MYWRIKFPALIIILQINVSVREKSIFDRFRRFRLKNDLTLYNQTFFARKKIATNK